MHKQKPMTIVREAEKKCSEQETVEEFLARGGKIQVIPPSVYVWHSNQGPARAHTNDYGGNI